MFSKTLMNHLDESVRRITDANKAAVYEDSKKYWNTESTDKQNDVISESTVNKVVKELTDSNSDYKVLIENLDSYLSTNKFDKHCTILEAAKKKIMNLNGE